MTQSAPARLEARNAEAFAEEERQGVMLAAKVRIVALVLVLTWQAIYGPDTGPSYYYYLLVISAFMVLGAVQFAFAWWRVLPRTANYAFVLADCGLMALTFSTGSPFDSTPLPPAISMDTARFLYFFMFLMQATFSFRPSLVVWCGVCIVVARGGMWLWFMNQPGVYTNLDLEEQTIAAWIAAGADLDFLFLGYAATELLVVVIVSAGLAVVVARSRNLVQTRLAAERTRTSLARYFSPNVADRLGRSDAPFSAARQQEVAVLFADIVGFTQLCETSSPEDVIDLLRVYHGRLGEAVFDNHGTLDKYIGDGLMATFGTPDPGPRDAANALNCAFAIIETLDAWNAERRASGTAPIRIGVGLHFGTVIAGDIGNDRRLEYGVVGDTVNVASRLEKLTRALGTSLVISDDLIRAVAYGDARAQLNLQRLRQADDQEIRGRASRVPIWLLPGFADARGAPLDTGDPA